MKLEEFRNDALAQVRAQRPEVGGDWPPVLLVEDHADQRHVVALPPGMLNSAAMPHLLDGLLANMRTKYFAFVNAAWALKGEHLRPDCETCQGEGMVRRADGKGLTNCPTCEGRGGPAQDFAEHPAREEVVLVMVGDWTGSIEQHVARVYRGTNGKRRPTIGPWESMTNVGGRIAVALRRTPVGTGAAPSAPPPPQPD